MNIMQMSLAGAILIIAVLTVRKLTLHKLPKNMFLVLWGIVICRLLIPFSLPSRFSFYTGLDILKRELKEAPAFTTPPQMAGIFHTYAASDAGQTFAVNQPLLSVPPVTIIWLAGLCALALFFILTYIKCCREFRTSLPIGNNFIYLWVKEHPMKRTVQVRQSDRIRAPLTYGIFRPVVLIPKALDLTDEMQLGYILAHEFVHIRRFDAFSKLLLTSVLCVHWFNPFVWVMYVLANRDIELSCDEAVVRQFGEAVKPVYAMTLIGMEEKKSRWLPLVNNFNKTAIEERIIAIMKMKKASRMGIVLALALVLGTTAAFATNTAEPASGTTSVSMATEGGALSDRLAEKQLSAERKKAMAAYEPFGLVYDEKTGELIFQNEKVRDFYDEQAGVGQSMTDGSVDLYPVYESGKLVGVKKLSRVEFDRRTAEKEAARKEMEQKRKELSVPDGAAFSYADDSAVSPNNTIEWYTYDEYKEWLEQEKVNLQKALGGKGWNPAEGWYVWTQERIDKAIQRYEQILQDIKNGAKVSRSVNGDESIGMILNPANPTVEAAAAGFALNSSGPPSVSYTAGLQLENGSIEDLGAYPTKEARLAAVKAFCDGQVKAGSMTRREADEITEKYK